MSIFKRKEVQQDVNYNELHIVDIFEDKKEKCIIIILYNDEENDNSRDILSRVWASVCRLHDFKSITNLRMKVEFKDGGSKYSIVAHDILHIPKSFKYYDYLNLVKTHSMELDKYFDEGEDTNTYSRIWVYLYY